MKRLFIISAFVLSALGLNAQNKVISGFGTAGVTNATQLLIPSITPYSYVFQVNANKAYVYTYSLKLIDNSGGNTASTVFAGSIDGVYYKTISTIAYGGNGADTTIIGNITSAPVSYKYLKFTITPNDTIWLKSIWLNAVPLN